MTSPTETLRPVAPRARTRRELGVAVIGFGWLGQAHSRSMLRIPTLFEDREFDARLVVCADAMLARIEEAMRSFGFERGTQDWRRVIDDADVFCRAVAEDRPFTPGFEDAVETVSVQAALLRSVQSGCWEDVVSLKED